MTTHYPARAKLDIALEALRIIAGERQCLDNLMGHADVAREALRLIGEREPIAPAPPRSESELIWRGVIYWRENSKCRRGS